MTQLEKVVIDTLIAGLTSECGIAGDMFRQFVEMRDLEPINPDFEVKLTRLIHWADATDDGFYLKEGLDPHNLPPVGKEAVLLNQLQMTCSKCNGIAVTRDATAAWDPELQDWTLAGVQDQAYCEDCADETTIVEVPYVVK